MKKNAVGNILYHQEPVRRRFSVWSLLARLLCLLLALVMWLILANASKIPMPIENSAELLEQDDL